LHPETPRGLRRRAEPRRPVRLDPAARAAGARGRHQERAPLQRPPHRRSVDRRWRPRAGETTDMTTTTATAKPAQLNRIGFEMKLYKGAESTLCAGCGHDSITNSLIKA